MPKQRTIIREDNRQGGQSSGGQISGRTFVPDQKIKYRVWGVIEKVFTSRFRFLNKFYVVSKQNLTKSFKNQKKGFYGIRQI